MSRELSRQAFIRGALGTAAAGALTACRAPAPEPQTPSTTSGLPSPEASGPPDWTALDDAIDGQVIKLGLRRCRPRLAEAFVGAPSLSLAVPAGLDGVPQPMPDLPVAG